LCASMGVTVESLQSGDGKTYPRAGQRVTAHYTGRLPDGSVFDSSVAKNRPFQFVIGRGAVIKGWDDGFLKLSVGEKARLTCTPDFAYGPRGHPPVIPPNATLIFDVELIAVE